MEEENRNASLDFIFEQVKGRLAAQDAQISTLDGKANLGFGASTLVTTLAGAKLEDILTSGRGNTFQIVVIYFIILVVIALYLSAIYCAYKSYKLRSYTTVPDPEHLRNEYLNKKEEETKRIVLNTLVEAFKRTETSIKDKVKWTNKTLSLFVIQAIVLLFVSLLPIFLKVMSWPSPKNPPNTTSSSSNQSRKYKTLGKATPKTPQKILDTTQNSSARSLNH